MTTSIASLQIQPLHASFGVEIGGVDLRQPLDPGTWTQIWDAFNDRSLLVFHDQALSDEEQMRLSERFGPLETTILARATRAECVHRHTWRQHDLVVWNNRCMLHRGRPWDARLHRRVMHRTTVAGDGPTA